MAVEEGSRGRTDEADQDSGGRVLAEPEQLPHAVRQRVALTRDDDVIPACDRRPAARAVQLDPALEFVGRPVQTDGKLLDLLVESGYLPTVACIAGDEAGNIYNVNADAMAVSVAVGWLAWWRDAAGRRPGTRDRASAGSRRRPLRETSASAGCTPSRPDSEMDRRERRQKKNTR